jgi:endonuclease/exonuclease/phosphatase family metal-dependent hydrolase
MRGLVVPILLVSLLATACAREEEPGPAPAKVPPRESSPAPAPEGVEPPPAQHAVTFNAGLARNYVPHVDPRRAGVIEALSGLDAEVVCLQEVWEDEDVEAVTRGVAARFPYAFHVATAGEAAAGPACEPEALRPLGACVSGPCAGAEDLPACVLKACAPAFLGLPGDCRTCLAANLSKPMDEALAACTGGGGSSLAYGGRNGLLLLSKHPLTETSHRVLDAYLLRRAVLHAKTRVIGGDVELFCTHLSAPLAAVEYQGAHGSWLQEQAHQIDQVIQWVEEIAAGESVILMGDMNCGPANAEWEVVAAAPENFQRFLDAGYRSPYTEDHGHCTWCGKSNPLVGDDPMLRILDHVLFTRVGAELLLPERILDQQRVETRAGRVPLSDHYGVRVAFELPAVKE